MSKYMSAKQASEQEEARTAFNNMSTQVAEMQQRDLRKEAEVNQLQLSLKTAELALAHKEAAPERIQRSPQLINDGPRRAPTKEARPKVQTSTTSPQEEASNPSLGCLHR